MKKPSFIEFTDNCLEVLRDTLLAKAPEEGCALLLGEVKELNLVYEENRWRVQMIWPCRNIWGAREFQFLETSHGSGIENSNTFSKVNRFLMNPKDQFMAQKWARKNNLEVLGSAHSHPNGKGFPSSLDRNSIFHDQLVLIVDKVGDAYAWWVKKDSNSKPEKVEFLSIK